jgi:hypothetical protein
MRNSERFARRTDLSHIDRVTAEVIEIGPYVPR